MINNFVCNILVYNINWCIFYFLVFLNIFWGGIYLRWKKWLVINKKFNVKSYGIDFMSVIIILYIGI